MTSMKSGWLAGHGIKPGPGLTLILGQGRMVQLVSNDGCIVQPVP